MALEPLDSDDRNALEKLVRALKRGDRLTQNALDLLVREWEPNVQPDSKDRAENFAVAQPDGTTTGVIGPRWAFHLFGLRHRAVEIAFRTERGLILLQRRSPTKDNWPDAPDMVVAGHLPQHSDGSDISWAAGAWKEIAEEIGLEEQNAAEDLLEKCLLPIGPPYCSYDAEPARNPPFYNAEVRQIFAATLTGVGLSRLHFADGEAVGLLLVTPETAWDMLARENVASGLRYSLPRYLDWLEKT